MYALVYLYIYLIVNEHYQFYIKYIALKKFCSSCQLLQLLFGCIHAFLRFYIFKNIILYFLPINLFFQ